MAKELQLRIGIGERDGVRSPIWRVFTTGDDAYIALRDMAHRQKISLHASRICRYARLDKLPLPAGMTDRCLKRWTRDAPPPKGSGAVSFDFSLVFPADHLSNSLETILPSKKIDWIAAPQSGAYARIVRFGFTYEDEDFIRAGFSDDLIAYHRLPSGEAFVVMSSVVEHEPVSFFLAGDANHNYDFVYPPFDIGGYKRNCEMSSFFTLAGEAHIYSLSGYKMPIGSIERHLPGAMGLKRHLVIEESAYSNMATYLLQ